MERAGRFTDTASSLRSWYSSSLMGWLGPGSSGATTTGSLCARLVPASESTSSSAAGDTRGVTWRRWVRVRKAAA